MIWKCQTCAVMNGYQWKKEKIWGNLEENERTGGEKWMGKKGGYGNSPPGLLCVDCPF